MALLREQHERWQNSVEQLLAQIRPEYTEVVADLKGEKSKAPTQSTPLEKSLETKPQVTRERPEISQDAMLAIDSTMMEAFQFQEKGPLKRVIGEILSDAAAKKMSTAELSGWELYRHQVKKMVDSKWFEWTAGAIILLNMITIGLETEVSLRSAEGVMIFTNLERVFLAIYTLELVVRFIAGGRASIRGRGGFGHRSNVGFHRPTGLRWDGELAHHAGPALATFGPGLADDQLLQGDVALGV